MCACLLDDGQYSTLVLLFLLSLQQSNLNDFSFDKLVQGTNSSFSFTKEGYYAWFCTRSNGAK
jgi:hypothetical protein